MRLSTIWVHALFFGRRHGWSLRASTERHTCSISFHLSSLIPQSHIEVSHYVSSRLVSGFHYQTSSLDSPHDKTFSSGTASSIVNLAIINACLYLGTHSKFLRFICFMTSSRLVSDTLSALTLFPSLLASHAFLAWMMFLATLSFPWPIAFIDWYANLFDGKVRPKTWMVHGEKLLSTSYLLLNVVLFSKGISRFLPYVRQVSFCHDSFWPPDCGGGLHLRSGYSPYY